MIDVSFGQFGCIIDSILAPTANWCQRTAEQNRRFPTFSCFWWYICMMYDVTVFFICKRWLYLRRCLVAWGNTLMVMVLIRVLICFDLPWLGSLYVSCLDNLHYSTWTWKYLSCTVLKNLPNHGLDTVCQDLHPGCWKFYIWCIKQHNQV